MKKLFIIKAGSTFAETAAKHGDFEAMTLRGLNLPAEQTAVVNAPAGEDLPDPADCLGAIITGAHSMVTDNLPWSLAIEAWIRNMIAAQTPLLGVCYGHQLLGRAMGGRVDYHPEGREVGTFEVRLRPESHDDPLFADLPQSFPVHATHAQSVLELPPGAFHLAENAYEPHHALRVGRCAWGVQFHPEYDVAIIKDYIDAQAELLSRAGQNVADLRHNVKETPHASSLLSKFVDYALQQQ